MSHIKEYLMVDLFAGCGGLSTGLEQAGFRPWFVNEIVETFCNTYRLNHPEVPDENYFVGDINVLNEKTQDYTALDTTKHEITLVCGGPPCQGFSMANQHL